MHAIVVEKDEYVVATLKEALAKDGCTVTSVAAIADVDEQRLNDGDFDIAIVDPHGLPPRATAGWIKDLRAKGAKFPLVVLSEETDVPTRVSVLDSGADDFVTKPFVPSELRARVRALTRRLHTPQNATITCSTAGEHVQLDFTKRLAYVGGAHVELTGREWAIVHCLFTRRGHVATRDNILAEVWDSQPENATPEQREGAVASLEVLVGRVRRKLGARVIRTVRGCGYALSDSFFV